MTEVWVYLSTSPLLWLALTLVCYGLAMRFYGWTGSRAYANPVATAVALLVLILSWTGTSYDSYFQGAQFVHFLLGPATVALAIPLAEQWSRLKRMVFPLILSLLVGTLVASLSALLIAHTLGASTATLASLAPKSVTTPIAMGISEKLGGLPSLTAVLVLLTGMVGAIFGPALFKRLSVRDDAIKGVALGVAAHGIGTARAFQLSDAAGAFAVLAMGLTALLSALLLPFLAPWVLQHLAR